MRYLIVAEAYRDLEQVSSRLALTERLAALLAQTPAGLLPTVCYLCQGLIAPEFAGVDLGLAEKLAVRAVATAAGTDAAQVTALVRETGDLGQAAERLLALPGAGAGGQAASLEVTEVVRTLREIAAAEGPGSQGRKLELLAGLLARATPLEARYLLRLVTRNLRLGIGTPTILDALAQVHAGGKAARPVLERGYNICCDLGKVAAALVSGGLAAVEQLRVQPGNPVRVMLAQRLADAGEILARLGGRCAAEYKYDGVRVQAHRTADGRIELFTRRLEEISDQFPDVVELLAGAGAGRGDRRGGGRRVRRGRGRAAAVRRGHAAAPQARHRPGRPGRARGPVLLRAAVRRRPGPDHAAVSAAARRAGGGPHPLAPAAADHRRRGHRPGRAGRDVRPGGHRRVRGPGVQVDRPGFRPTRPGRAAGSGSSSSGTTGPSCPTPPTWSSSARSPGAAAAPGSTARCCWPPTTRTPTCSAP